MISIKPTYDILGHRHIPTTRQRFGFGAVARFIASDVPLGFASRVVCLGRSFRDSIFPPVTVVHWLIVAYIPTPFALYFWKKLVIPSRVAVLRCKASLGPDCQVFSNFDIQPPHIVVDPRWDTSSFACGKKNANTFRTPCWWRPAILPRARLCVCTVTRPVRTCCFVTLRVVVVSRPRSNFPE